MFEHLPVFTLLVHLWVEVAVVEDYCIRASQAAHTMFSNNITLPKIKLT